MGNAVLVNGDAVGPTLYYGRGAGAEATASAVVADLIDVTRMATADPEQRVPHLAFQPDQLSSEPILPMDEIEARETAQELLKSPPEIGYLTISNALQWRLQYGRVIEKAGNVQGIHRIR